MKSLKYKLIILLIFLNVFAINNLFAIEVNNIVIVIKDSIPLREEPNDQSKIAKYAFASLKLKVLEISESEEWYKIKIGEQKGYQLKHDERHWVFKEDVYHHPESSYANIRLDVSVLENQGLKNVKRLSQKDYIYKLKSLKLDTDYYVSSTSQRKSIDKLYSQFSINANIYRPGHYFIYKGYEKYTDASNLEELRSRYKQLYENGKITPFYEIFSNFKIKIINEKLICAKIIMENPGCYPDKYIGTELDILNDKIHNVNDY